MESLPVSLCISQMSCEIQTVGPKALWTPKEKQSYQLRTSKWLPILKNLWSALGLAAGRSLRTPVLGKGIFETTIWPAQPHHTWFYRASSNEAGKVLFLEANANLNVKAFQREALNWLCFFFQVYWDIIGIHHFKAYSLLVWFTSIVIWLWQWVQPTDSFSQKPNKREKKNRKKALCDENSWDLLY